MPRFVLENRLSQQAVGEVWASARDTLFDALARSDWPIQTTCRGSTICGLCWVEVKDGLDALPEPAADERELLDANANGRPRARLACRLKIPDGLDELVVATDYWRPPQV